jgi:hypothetical protein
VFSHDSLPAFRTNWRIIGLFLSSVNRRAEAPATLPLASMLVR